MDLNYGWIGKRINLVWCDSIDIYWQRIWEGRVFTLYHSFKILHMYEFSQLVHHLSVWYMTRLIGVNMHKVTHSTMRLDLCVESVDAILDSIVSTTRTSISTSYTFHLNFDFCYNSCSYLNDNLCELQLLIE
jgi:hypothetical protein